MVGQRSRFDLNKCNQTINNYIGHLRTTRSARDDIPKTTEEIIQLLEEICDLPSFETAANRSPPLVASR